MTNPMPLPHRLRCVDPMDQWASIEERCNLAADELDRLEAGREHYRAEWEKCVNEIDRLSSIEDRLTKELANQDRILRASVPEEFKHATCPVGCVQNYIAHLERIEVKYKNLCAVLNEQAGEILDLKEQLAALQSREVCTVAHENVETCGYCQRDAIEAELERIAQARLTWAMACQCTCDACESFSSVIRKACFQSEPQETPK